MHRFYMPVRVFEGGGCVLKNEEIWAKLGKRALIVTGKTSAARSGALEDVIDVLDSVGIAHTVYDNVRNNPTVENAHDAGGLGREFAADFVIGIGGGSPLDAAKAAAVFAVNDIKPMEVYGEAANAPLPVVCIPTTAGTGSEVTPYSVLTVDSLETKVTLKGDHIFPKYAFLDSGYIRSMPPDIAVYTALDALCHCVESVLNTQNSPLSEAAALEGLRIIGRYIGAAKTAPIDDEAGEQLLRASMLAGVAIAQTGTNTIHSVGYALTYYKNMQHGHANGILLTPFMKYASKYVPDEAGEIYKALGVEGYNGLKALIASLDLQCPEISGEEAESFSAKTIKSASLAKNLWRITQEEEKNMILQREV